MKLSISMLLLSLSLSSMAQTCAPARIELVGDGHRDQTGISLKFSMKYLGCQPLLVQEARLPWGARGAIELTAVKNDKARTPLKQLGYISDPGSDNIELSPSKVYSGKVGLSSRFKGIDAAADADGVIVSWTYTLHGRTGEVIGPVHGNVVLGGPGGPSDHP